MSYKQNCIIQFFNNFLKYRFYLLSLSALDRLPSMKPTIRFPEELVEVLPTPCERSLERMEPDEVPATVKEATLIIFK